MRKLAYCFLISISTQLVAQDSLKVADSVGLSMEQVIKMTLAFHPVVSQANLISLDAEANLRMARGGLDPKIEVDYDLKNFKQIEYYDLLTTTLKVPTWIGLDPKVEFVRNEGDNNGQFVNDQNSIPEDDGFKQLQWKYIHRKYFLKCPRHNKCPLLTMGIRIYVEFFFSTQE